MPAYRARVLLATRIYLPEPGAAPLRLASLTNALVRDGARVEVLTSTPPPGVVAHDHESEALTIKRASVLRNEHGYLRGYLQYLSFDVPLALRLLLAKRPDVVVCEPPPTTGLVVKSICWLRRLPYVYYAADLWSDAANATDAPRSVVRAVRAVERSVLRGAETVLSVGTTYSDRMRQWQIRGVETVGHGIDTELFGPHGPRRALDGPYFLYAGTASEVHGATVFVEAFRRLLQTRPEARLVFLGHGEEFANLRRLAAEFPEHTMTVLPQRPADEAAEWIRGAVATLASVRPGTGYEYFVPTKSYASLACGVPVIHAGPGPLGPVLTEEGLGIAVPFDPEATAAAMATALDRYPADDVSARACAWARTHVSAQHVGDRAAQAVLQAGRRRKGRAASAH